MSSYTKFSSKPRVIKGSIGCVVLLTKRENHASYDIQFSPIGEANILDPYRMSISARNALATIRDPEVKVVSAYAEIQEIECLDEGDVKPDYICNVYHLDRSNRIDIPVDQAIDLIKKYVDPDQAEYPKYKFELLMRWNETVHPSGHVSESFEVKCDKLETDGSFNWRAAHDEILLRYEEEQKETKPKRGRPKKKD